MKERKHQRRLRKKDKERYAGSKAGGDMTHLHFRNPSKLTKKLLKRLTKK